ncbi:hypothetical protein A2U01_0106221, partial [Trifolium medium]|nr:hypothetical protein [Trifolium medium]
MGRGRAIIQHFSRAGEEILLEKDNMQ